MDLVKVIVLKFISEYVSKNLHQEDVVAALKVIDAKLRAEVEATENKWDDKVLDTVERIVTGEVLVSVEKMVLDLASEIVAKTPGDLDDAIVAVVKKALLGYAQPAAATEGAAKGKGAKA